MAACALGTFAVGACTTPAQDQTQLVNIGGAQSNYAGIGRATGSGDCPGIGWDFRANPGSPDLLGYVMFNDASGISIAQGTGDRATGKFQLTLTSIDGKGPTGTVTGTKGADGSLNAVLVGPGCSNVTIKHASPSTGIKKQG